MSESDVVIYGTPLSSFTRTACMTCAEKGVAYEVSPVEFRSESHRELHPFLKVPAMKHGDVHLYETVAIVRYIDAAFDGPALQPSEPHALGLMDQYISVACSYLYPHLVRKYVLKYAFAGDGGPDRADIAAALPTIKQDVALIDEAYSKSEWIAGDQLTLADIFVTLTVGDIGMFPEGVEILSSFPNITRALDNMRQRESYKALHPPQQSAQQKPA